MADDALALQRAAGAVLRAWTRPAVPLARFGQVQRPEAVRPALAAQAIVAAMRARFGLAPEAAAQLLLPAFVDFRDALGCADPLLMPANALGSSGEKQLVPMPLPSWSAHLVDAGVLRLDGPPAVEGARVVQHGWIVAVREAELSAVECFPVTFAGKFAPPSVAVHLAMSPPYLSDTFRGPVCLRAAIHSTVKGHAPVPLWLGGPSSPTARTSGVAGVTVATWGAGTRPRWAVLRVREGREPQALWDVEALWRARAGSAPEATPGGTQVTAPSAVRIAVDVGSTATMVVEEESAASASLGGKLVARARPGVQRSIASGFRRLAGDPGTAHLYGCGERLQASASELPTALVVPDAQALGALLDGGDVHAAWLPQAPPDGAPHDAAEPCLRVDRFKSPELLLWSEWLAAAPRAAERDLGAVSRRLLEAYGELVGRALASAHAAPLVTAEGGRWTLRWPRLDAAEAVLTYPQCALTSSSSVPFSAVFDGVGAAMLRGLSSAWASTSHRLVPDAIAARSAPRPSSEPVLPIEAFVDFGGLTLQVAVRVPGQAGRPAPFIGGSSTAYLLGGERLIDALAYAAADAGPQASGLGPQQEVALPLREAYRSAARRLRRIIASGGALREGDSAAAALRESLLGTLFALVRRQLEGTLRRAAPDQTRLRGAGVRLLLLGAGWKLLALDAPDERREDETLRRLTAHLAAHPLLENAEVALQRLSKRSLCEGALHARGEPARDEDAVELQGVDVASGDALCQRWFGVVPPRGGALDVLPHGADAWWKAFSGDARDEALLRVEQWFSAPEGDSPFASRLAAGKLSFDPRRSLLKQWLDVSGPSLFALRIRDELRGAAR